MNRESIKSPLQLLTKVRWPVVSVECMSRLATFFLVTMTRLFPMLTSCYPGRFRVIFFAKFHVHGLQHGGALVQHGDKHWDSLEAWLAARSKVSYSRVLFKFGNIEASPDLA